MKKNIMFGVLGWIVSTVFGFKAIGQEGSKPNQKETQEIIIRKKGDKDTKVTVEITGDKVLINGKPMAEFNEEGITINNRKMIIRDGDRLLMDLDGKRMDLEDMQIELGDKLSKLEKIGVEGFRMDSDDNELMTKLSKPYTYLGVSTEKTGEGAKITDVSKNSPAEEAGLQKDDIIYKVGDKKIENPSDLSETIKAMKKADKVKVYFLRDNKKKEVTAILGTNDMKISINRSFTYDMPNGKRRSLTIPRYPNGMDFYNDNMENSRGLFFNMSKSRLGIKIQDTDEGNGVKILEVEKATAAETAGLLKDDIITEIAGKKINNTDEAREELQTNKDKNTYDIKAKRNGTEMTFSIKIPKKLKTATL